MNHIGLHITNGTRLPLAGSHGAPRVVTLLDCSPEYHRQVREEVGPDCLICARFYQRDQPLADPEADAERWMARWYPQMRAIADPNTVMLGYCEIPDDLAPAYARFEVRRIALLHGVGMRAGVGQWSVGVPDLHVWQIYRPALEAMVPGDVVILHEYWADGGDIGNHWYTARFAHPSVAPHLAGKRIAITECGRDVLHLGGGRTRGAPGWQRTCDAEMFYDELRAYDRLIAQYPNVIGATVYNSGGADPEWAPFDPAPVWGRVVAEYTESAPALPAVPPAEEATVNLLPMDGRLMDLGAFRQHLATVDLSWVRRVVIHHTAEPDEALWVKWGGWPYWKLRLREYYSGLGWLAMPHLFAGPDGVGILWSLGGPGRGVGGGALEAGCLHIEIVGLYTHRVPEGATLETAVGAAAAILEAAGLGAEALTNHSRVVGGWECPGAALKAAWGWFAELVAAARVAQEAPADLEEAIGEAIQAAIVPLNPSAAFEVEGAARGLLPASTEVDVEVGGVAYRAQAYRHPGERDWQQIVYARVGQWGDLTWFERRN